MVFNNEYLSKIREKAMEFNAKKVILFGSALENPEKCNDIDLACDIPNLDIFLFASKLEELFEIPIDIVPIVESDPFMKMVYKYGKVIYES